MRCAVFGWVLSGVLTMGLSGCGEPVSSPASLPQPTAPPLTESTPETEINSVPEVQPAAEPDAPPVAAVRGVLEGIDSGELETLADFLPESYQQDLSALVHLVAEKAPDDVWTRWQSVAEKGASLLRNKPEFAAILAGGTALPEEEAQQARLTTAIDLLSDPAAWNRAEWREFQLRPFLKDIGSPLLQGWQAVAPPSSSLMSQTKVRLLKLEGEAAELEFRTPVDPEPRTVEFVLIEGKWIPKSLASGWEATVRAARTQFEQLDEARFTKFAAQMEQVLAPIDGTLSQLLRSSRVEELQLGVWQMQSLLLQGLRDWQGAGPPPRVEIRLAEEISDDELSKLLQQLVAACDQPDAAEYVTFPTGKGTLIQLSPVRNFEEFVARLMFVTVKSQDAGKRSVEVAR